MAVGRGIATAGTEEGLVEVGEEIEVVVVAMLGVVFSLRLPYIAAVVAAPKAAPAAAQTARVIFDICRDYPMIVIDKKRVVLLAKKG